jgi:sugar lactone lactonase YvrE
MGINRVAIDELRRTSKSVDGCEQADGRCQLPRVRYVGRDQTLPPGSPPTSNADGVVADDEGRLYALTESGIEVLSPTGQPLGVIPLWCITRRCQNLGFGGPDKRILYVAGGGTLPRIPMLAREFHRKGATMRWLRLMP